jgi:lipooligosaccharide transport system permease protein
LYHVSHLARSFVLGQMSWGLVGDVAWIVVFTSVMLIFPTRLVRKKLLV